MQGSKSRRDKRPEKREQEPREQRDPRDLSLEKRVCFIEFQMHESCGWLTDFEVVG